MTETNKEAPVGGQDKSADNGVEKDVPLWVDDKYDNFYPDSPISSPSPQQ